MAAESESGRTIYPKIGVWYASDNGHIRLSIEGQGLTSVSNDPGSVRYHGPLYKKLASLLLAHGKQGPPGAEETGSA